MDAFQSFDFGQRTPLRLLSAFPQFPFLFPFLQVLKMDCEMGEGTGRVFPNNQRWQVCHVEPNVVEDLHRPL